MSTSAKSYSDRLVNTMYAAAPNFRAGWDDLVGRMKKLSLTDAEYDYFCDAVTSTEDNEPLVDLLARAIWDDDRASMHVMTRSYPSIIQIIRHAKDQKRDGVKTVRALLESEIHPSWTTASRSNSIPAEDYDEMSAYINARFLSKSIYLHPHDAGTQLKAMKEITFPLMEHNDIIVPATTVIVNVWEAVRENRTRQYLRIEDVLGMARVLQDSPELGDLFVSFGAERGYFNLEAAMEYATLSARALKSGAL